MQGMVVYITTQEATPRAIARYGSTAGISAWWRVDRQSIVGGEHIVLSAKEI